MSSKTDIRGISQISENRLMNRSYWPKPSDDRYFCIYLVCQGCQDIYMKRHGMKSLERLLRVSETAGHARTLVATGRRLPAVHESSTKRRDGGMEAPAVGHAATAVVRLTRDASIAALCFFGVDESRERLRR